MIKDEYKDWSTANQAYLMGMIKLVRKRLEWYRQSTVNAEEKLQPEQDVAVNDLKEIAGAMAEPPAIDKLAHALGLSSFEKEVLLLCAGMELDGGLSDLVNVLHAENTPAFPSFSFALAALENPHWSALSPGGPLRYWRLTEVNRSQLVTRSPLKIDEHILHYLAGIRQLHETLKEFVNPASADGYIVPSHLKLAEHILDTSIQKKTGASLPVFQFTGNNHADKLTIASYICSAAGLQLYNISAYTLPVNMHDIIEFTRLWNREAGLNNYGLFLDCSDIDMQDRPKLQSLINVIQNIQGLLILATDQWTPDIKRPNAVFEIDKPTAAEQLELWEKISGGNGYTESLQLGKLVSQFNLSASTICSAGTAFINANMVNGHQDAGLEKKLWKACCSHTRPKLDELAQNIIPAAGWDDLILPEQQKSILQEVAAQVKQRNKVYHEWGFAKKGMRGLGITVLFSGESGTGKTMAAEVLANELELDLYKIDLSKVVNKYIGETEKNLKRIFDAAEDGGAILLFDEADALFGKRSDVKDSHDRYSNIEVSYLLQRMEAYRGLAILTTNMKSALDKAFLRRIRFAIQFPFPDALHRAEIWRRVFPVEMPRHNLDIEKLSKLNLPGGSIRNIALNAAFNAADNDTGIQMLHISRAAKTEYEKLEKTLTNNEIKGWI